MMLGGNVRGMRFWGGLCLAVALARYFSVYSSMNKSDFSAYYSGKKDILAETAEAGTRLEEAVETAVEQAEEEIGGIEFLVGIEETRDEKEPDHKITEQTAVQKNIMEAKEKEAASKESNPNNNLPEEPQASVQEEANKVEDGNDKEDQQSTAPLQEDLTKLEKCFPLNSKEWLKGPRHGNIQDPLMNDDFVSKMILFHPDSSQDTDTVLQRSMCLKDSRFLNATDPLADERSMELWMVRLTFLAMHQVQHQFAVKEARQRKDLSKDCQRLADDYRIGPFDYECPDGKLFVLPIENLGLGAIMRTNVFSGLLAALATNRAVLFVNHAPTGPKPIREPWYHASCDRQDVQCFFHPPTPCVVTHAQLDNAVVMNEFRNVTKLFKNPPRLMAEEWFDAIRTIVLPLKTVTRRVPKTIPDILRTFTLGFAKGLATTDPRQEVLAKVADRFVSVVHSQKVNQLISYGLVFYAMRPHWKSQQQLQQVLEKVVPAAKFHPEVTLGLPIRASDKCIEESECLSFEQYMRVLSQIWNRHKTNLTEAMAQASVDKLQIVLTSESASVMKEKDDFLADADLVQKVPFPFEIITNDFDIQQDTGNPKFNDPEHNLDVLLQENNADQVMLSMISSLQTQLTARYSIGNCCSNFHRLMFELLDGGCGAAYQSSPECLQKNEDPEFRICCVWDKREECKGVQETIEQKWAAVKRKRMAERMRRQEQQGRVKGVHSIQ